MMELEKNKNITFDVLNKDNLTASVCVKDGTVSIKRYTDNPVIQPFGKAKPETVAVINDFLESRCFDSNRADKKELLKELRLRYYDPISIIKKTHGRIWDDFTWIRFPGEDITWKDVANGRM